MGVSTQSTGETGGRMQVLLAVRSLVGLLATLAIAKAAKLNDDALYHVVEDLPGNETQESGGENVATCSDVMARNGLNFSSFWHGAAHGLHSLHLEEIRHFFEPDATENNKIPVVNKNLSSQQTILFDAPLAGYDEHFNTMAIKVQITCNAISSDVITQNDPSAKPLCQQIENSFALPVLGDGVLHA